MSMRCRNQYSPIRTTLANLHTRSVISRLNFTRHRGLEPRNAVLVELEGLEPSSNTLSFQLCRSPYWGPSAVVIASPQQPSATTIVVFPTVNHSRDSLRSSSISAENNRFSFFFPIRFHKRFAAPGAGAQHGHFQPPGPIPCAVTRR